MLARAGADAAPPAAVLQMVARAVWRHDVRTAKAFIRTNSVAARLMTVIDGAMCLLSPVSFAAEHAAAKVLQLATDLDAKARVKTPVHRVEAVARKQRLWSLLGRRCFLLR